MKCPNCGAFLEEDSRFCISCGANLEEIEKSTQAAPDLASKGADPRQQESGSEIGRASCRERESA